MRRGSASDQKTFLAGTEEPPKEERRGATRRRACDDRAMVVVRELRLPVTAPFDGAGLHGALAARAAAGLERVGGATYARTMRLPGGPASATLDLGAGAVPSAPRPDGAPGSSVADGAAPVPGTLRLTGPGDHDDAVSRIRALLDLDADPAVVDGHLARDPALAPLVAARPGLRVLGTVDPFELALRAVIGQQVSVAAARTVLGRIVTAHGDAVPEGLDPGGRDAPALRLLPAPAVVAALPDDALPMPRSRAATVRRLGAAVAAGEVDLRPGAEAGATTAALLALPGIGPWTAGYVAMRGLGDRDAFPAGDLVLRRSAGALGLPSDERGLAAYAARWSPWRAYAAQHLWAAA